MSSSSDEELEQNCIVGELSDSKMSLSNSDKSVKRKTLLLPKELMSLNNDDNSKIRKRQKRNIIEEISHTNDDCHRVISDEVAEKQFPLEKVDNEESVINQH